MSICFWLLYNWFFLDVFANPTMPVIPFLATDITKLIFASTNYMRTPINFLNSIHTAGTHCVIEFIEQELNLCIKTRSLMFLKWTIRTILFITYRTYYILSNNNKHSPSTIVINAKFHERIIFHKINA